MAHHFCTSEMTIPQFRESLVRSLLFGTPFENLKPGPRKQSTRHSKHKLPDHKLEEIEGPAAMFEDVVLVATKKSENKNQEKQVRWQQKE
jgi:hypothetical protein